MARFTYQLHGTFDGAADQIKKVELDVPDSEMQHFFNAYRTTYGQVPQDPNNPGGPQRDMTDVETFTKYGTGLGQGTMAQVRRDREVKVAQDAVASLPPPFMPAVAVS